MKKVYKVYCDAGHAWMAVKRKELIELGLIDKISGYSYQKGETVYLEEDCDLGLFVQTKGRENIIFKEKYCEYSPIRSYFHFEKRLGE